jgi:DNA-binding MarR family transcriptional regulator
MLGRLERDGILSRTRVRNDARSVNVTLTARGRTIAQRAEKQMMLHQEQMVAGFSEADLRTFRSLLLRSYERVTAAGAERAAERVEIDIT